MTEEIYGIQIVGKGDQPIMIDHRGLVQTWADTVIENVEGGHPIYIKLYLSEDVRYVRQLKLNLRFEEFRAYDRAADNLDEILTTKEPAGNHTHTVEFDIKGEASHEIAGTGSATRYTGPAQTDGGDGHQHSYTIEYRYVETYDQHVHHELEHGYVHTGTEGHYHDSEDHKHPMEQGIWEGSAMEPESVTVKLNDIDIEETFESTVENVKLPVEELVYGWNTIEISSSALGRISASYFMQVFMNV